MTDFEDMDSMNGVDVPNVAKNRSALRKLFDDTRKRLVETGTRNRLVHVNRANTRGNILNIINERSDDVYSFLSSKKMRFLGIGKDKDDTSTELQLVHAGDEGFDDGRYGDNQLEVKLGPETQMAETVCEPG